MKATIIGAGPAGLATAACVKRIGMEVSILERADTVGARWRGHYDRLELHTARGRSGLPGMPMPDSYPRYPRRDQVVRYLEDYARANDLRPDYGATVRDVSREDGKWRVLSTRGTSDADVVVFATGLAEVPNRPALDGLKSFPGPVLHSSGYLNPRGLDGRRVLVVGFGNSGGDIALDLAGAGREVDVVVRGPVNLLPKELFGIPITSFEVLTRLLPYRWADAITAPVLRLAIGKPEHYGMHAARKGPAAQVIEDGRIPLIDVGTLAAIREGRIGVRPGVERFEGQDAVFADGTRSTYDAVVLATGYRTDLRPLLPKHPDVLDQAGVPLVSGGRCALPGLYFCSYVVSANGQFKRISQEALAIAEDAARWAADVVSSQH